MANFKKITSTVCGASKELNDMLNSVDDFADDLVDKLQQNLDPTALIDGVEDKLKAAEKGLKDMLPTLPTIKSLGLQDELEALKAVRDNAVLFAEKLAGLTIAFGSLDFEKLMEAACEADNKKVVNGEVVTLSKNVTMEGQITTEEVGNAAATIAFIENKSKVNDGLYNDSQNLFQDTPNVKNQENIKAWLGHRQTMRASGYSEKDINTFYGSEPPGGLGQLAAQQVKAFEERAQGETITGDYQG